MTPIIFQSIVMERVWGGRELESRLGRRLPEGQPIGESWELSDREEAQSVVVGGVWEGKTLHELWTKHREEVFGERYAGYGERFPLLCKILDARDRLSLQVHPPIETALELGGEPKTEVWYFLSCDPGSEIYAGLRGGVTKEEFEKALHSGDVEECVGVLATSEGDSIFIPSGRLHAIGSGNLIVEIQQNSDTTYRVFDWNREGLDGKPRDLHIEEALISTDFEDFDPQLDYVEAGVLAACPYFRVGKHVLKREEQLSVPGDFAIITMVEGKALCGGVEFSAGDFFLLPAIEAPLVAPVGDACGVLVTTIP